MHKFCNIIVGISAVFCSFDAIYPGELQRKRKVQLKAEDGMRSWMVGKNWIINPLMSFRAVGLQDSTWQTIRTTWCLIRTLICTWLNGKLDIRRGHHTMNCWIVLKGVDPWLLTWFDLRKDFHIYEIFSLNKSKDHIKELRPLFQIGFKVPTLLSNKTRIMLIKA